MEVYSCDAIPLEISDSTVACSEVARSKLKAIVLAKQKSEMSLDFREGDNPPEPEQLDRNQLKAKEVSLSKEIEAGTALGVGRDHGLLYIYFGLKANHKGVFAWPSCCCRYTSSATLFFASKIFVEKGFSRVADDLKRVRNEILSYFKRAGIAAWIEGNDWQDEALNYLKGQDPDCANDSPQVECERPLSDYSQDSNAVKGLLKMFWRAYNDRPTDWDKFPSNFRGPAHPEMSKEPDEWDAKKMAEACANEPAKIKIKIVDVCQPQLNADEIAIIRRAIKGASNQLLQCCVEIDNADNPQNIPIGRQNADATKSHFGVQADNTPGTYTLVVAKQKLSQTAEATGYGDLGDRNGSTGKLVTVWKTANEDGWTAGTIAHELGHNAGLVHFGHNQKDIMEAACLTKEYEKAECYLFTDDDCEAIQRLPQH